MTLTTITALLEPQEFNQIYSYESDDSANTYYLQIARVVLGRNPVGFATHGTVQAVQPLAAAISMVLQEEHVVDGARALRTILDAEPAGTGRAVAATLAYTSGLSELDDYRRVLDELRHQLEAVRLDESNSGLLYRALLITQLHLRSSDSGLPTERLWPEALDCLNRIDLNDLAADLDSNLIDDPNSAATKLIAHSSAAVASHIPIFGSPNDEQNREIQSRILGDPESAMISTYADLLEKYRKFVLGVVKNEYLGSQYDLTSHGEDGFFQVLRYELFGHLHCQNLRRHLANLRAAISYELNAPGYAKDCIRLLRHSMDAKALEDYVGSILRDGPLESLATDVRQVVFNRAMNAILRSPELVTIEFGADLLSAAECEVAMDNILHDGNFVVPPDTPYSWSAASVRVGHVIRASFALAESSGNFERAVTGLVNLLRHQKPELSLDQEIAKSVRQIEWADFQTEANAVLATISNNRDWPRVRDVLSSYTKSTEQIDAGLDLNGITNKLNLLLSRKYAVQELLAPDQYIEVANTIESRLNAIRESALSGSHTGYLIDAADVAVLAIELLGLDLWGSLAAFLLDAHVWASEKDAAFNRLATNALEIPPATLALFKDSANELLEPPISMLDNGIRPVSSALRFLASRRLISSSDLLMAISSQMADRSVRIRRSAARTVFVVSITNNYEWIWPIAFQASFDSDASVRSWAAACMVRQPVLTEAHEQRLYRLALSDGVGLPNTILQVLSEPNNKVLTARWDGLIEQFATNHPSASVRKRAERLRPR